MAWTNNIQEAYDDIRPLFKSKSFIIYDTETTGLNPKKDRIIQFSAVKVSVPAFEIISELDIYIRCPFSVPKKASDVNRITDDVLSEKGLEEIDAFLKIQEFLGTDPVISGYNNDKFDNNFMQNLYGRFGKEFNYAASVDIMKIAKKVIPPDSVFDPAKKRASYKQENCVAYYGSVGDFAYHSSIEDVKAANFLLTHLIYDIQTSYEQEKAEEKLRNQVPKRNATIRKMSIFNPSIKINRVYVDTNQGKFYYDNCKHVWDAKAGQGNTDSIDMLELKKKALELTGTKSDAEFYRVMSKRKDFYLYMWLPYEKDGEQMAALVPTFWTKAYIMNTKPFEIPENWEEDMLWYEDVKSWARMLVENIMDANKAVAKAEADKVIIKTKAVETVA